MYFLEQSPPTLGIEALDGDQLACLGAISQHSSYNPRMDFSVADKPKTKTIGAMNHKYGIQITSDIGSSHDPSMWSEVEVPLDASFGGMLRLAKIALSKPKRRLFYPQPSAL